VVYSQGFSLYVANSSPSLNQILVFAPYANGNVAPVRVIEGPLTEMPATGEIGALVTGPEGYLYVYWGEVGGVNAAILVFAPQASGNVAPVRIIAGSNTQLGGYRGMDVDILGRLYVASNGPTLTTGEILVFADGANGNVAPIRTIYPQIPANASYANVFDVAVGGKLIYVANAAGSEGIAVDTSIDVFSINAHGVSTPSCKIGGSGSHIASGNVQFLATAPGGDRVWALMFAPPVDTTRTFRAYNYCDSHPVATLGGANTGFNGPTGAAFDAKGYLYVSDQTWSGDGTVWIFAPTDQNGNVTPTFVLQGSNTQLLDPLGITIGPTVI